MRLKLMLACRSVMFLQLRASTWRFCGSLLAFFSISSSVLMRKE